LRRRKRNGKLKLFHQEGKGRGDGWGSNRDYTVYFVLQQKKGKETGSWFFSKPFQPIEETRGGKPACVVAKGPMKLGITYLRKSGGERREQRGGRMLSGERKPKKSDEEGYLVGTSQERIGLGRKKRTCMPRKGHK